MPAQFLLRPFKVLSQTYKHLRHADSSVLSKDERKRAWAEEMLEIMNVDLAVSGTPTAERPGIFVGNHVSYIDIPLLLAHVPDLSFVAKQELASWPLFGRGMRKMDTIFVQRNSPASRGNAKESLQLALEKERKAVIIFPSGTTSLHEEQAWKLGAFRLAEKTGAPLQPFRLTYHPLRPAAFIDDDSFLLHLMKAGRNGRIRASLEFAPAEIVTDAKAACARWQKWATRQRLES